MVLDRATVERLFDVCIGEDNQACISETLNPVLSDLSKHIDLKYQFLVDHIRKGDVGIRYVCTEEMIADILSKNLSAQNFGQLVRRGGIE